MGKRKKQKQGKPKVYCSIVERYVEIAKRKNPFKEDIFVCQQPWTEPDKTKTRGYGERRGNLDVPCEHIQRGGYNWNCSELETPIFDKDTKKPEEPEKPQEPPKKPAEPKEVKEPEYVSEEPPAEPEEPETPEEPPEEELTDDVLLAMRRKYYPSYKHDDPHYQILVLIQKAISNCDSPVDRQTRLAIRGASQHAGEGNYEEMEKCLGEAEQLIDSDRDTSRIRSSVEKLYVIRHGPLPVELVDDPGDSVEELLADMERDEDESPETDKETSETEYLAEDIETTYTLEEEKKLKIDEKRRKVGKLLSKAKFNNQAGTFIWGAVRAVGDRNYSLMMTLLNEAERRLDSESQKDDMIVIRAGVEELYKLEHGSALEKAIND